MRDTEATVIVFALMIMAGAGLMIAAMFNRRRIREMEHRERLAMIERGLMPSPEANPARFEAEAGFTEPTPSRAAVRYRNAGVLLIGVGLGLLMLFTFTTHDAGLGFGIGGGWAVLGAACLLNYSLITRREDERRHMRSHAQPRYREPPSNIAP